MSANNLAEIAVDLIEAHIKANIGTALTEVRTARADAFVTTEVPQSYFIYPKPTPWGYRCPAVFVIVENIDFKLDRGQNHINSRMKINVAVLVEDKDLDHLTVKAYRYQAALNKILEETALSDAALTVRYIVKVIRAEYSTVYSNAQRDGDPQGAFRKEVLLELEVEDFEQF